MSVRFGHHCSVSSNHGDSEKQQLQTESASTIHERCVERNSVSTVAMVHLVSTWAYGSDQRKGSNAAGSAELFDAFLSGVNNKKAGVFYFVLKKKWDLCCSYIWCVSVFLFFIDLF